MSKSLIVLMLLAAITFFVGCEASNNPALPDDEGSMSPKTTIVENSDILWGLWTIVLDPADPQIIPLRTADMNLNVLTFLEPPALTNLTLEGMGFVGSDIDWVDIGLKHPFGGLTEFTGFDVKGVLFANRYQPEYQGFTEATNLGGTIFIPPDDTSSSVRLQNPDGWTDLFNPTEYDGNDPMFNYKDGLLGTPDSYANYDFTVNSFKYFADDLTSTENISSLNLSSRGMFSAGSKNIRRYNLLATGIPVFNYAVAASWEFPTGPAPWTAPDDFPLNANQNAPLFLSVDTSGPGLTTQGGSLTIDCEVKDWQNDTIEVRADAPGLFFPSKVFTEGASFSLTFANELGAPVGDYWILLVAESPGTNGKEYFPLKVSVSFEAGAGWSTPELIAPNLGGGGVDPFAIFDNLGNLWLFWMDQNPSDSGKKELYGGWYDGISWNSAILTNIPGDGGSWPRADIEGNNLYIAFKDNGLHYGFNDVLFSFFPITAPPTPPLSYEVVSDIDPVNYNFATTPDILVQGSKVTVVWSDQRPPRNTQTEVFLRERISGTWQTAERLTDDIYDSKTPFIEEDSTGDRYIVWYDYLNTHFREHDTDIEYEIAGFQAKDMLINASDQVFLSLNKEIQNKLQVFYLDFPAGSAPGTPIQLTNDPILGATSGNFTEDGSDIVLFWKNAGVANSGNISGFVLMGNPTGVDFVNIVTGIEFYGAVNPTSGVYHLIFTTSTGIYDTYSL